MTTISKKKMTTISKKNPTTNIFNWHIFTPFVLQPTINDILVEPKDDHQIKTDLDTKNIPTTKNIEKRWTFKKNVMDDSNFSSSK